MNRSSTSLPGGASSDKPATAAVCPVAGEARNDVTPTVTTAASGVNTPPTERPAVTTKSTNSDRCARLSYASYSATSNAWSAWLVRVVVGATDPAATATATAMLRTVTGDAASKNDGGSEGWCDSHSTSPATVAPASTVAPGMGDRAAHAAAVAPHDAVPS